MPGKDFSGLREELLAGGLSPDTPATLVSHVGMVEQQQRSATLAGLDKLQPMETPAVLLIGQTVGGVCRREQLDDTAVPLDVISLLL
jgi:siroheme synthase